MAIDYSKYPGLFSESPLTAADYAKWDNYGQLGSFVFGSGSIDPVNGEWAPWSNDTEKRAYYAKMMPQSAAMNTYADLAGDPETLAAVKKLWYGYGDGDIMGYGTPFIGRTSDLLAKETAYTNRGEDYIPMDYFAQQVYKTGAYQHSYGPIQQAYDIGSRWADANGINWDQYAPEFSSAAATAEKNNMNSLIAKDEKEASKYGPEFALTMMGAIAGLGGLAGGTSLFGDAFGSLFGGGGVGAEELAALTGSNFGGSIGTALGSVGGASASELASQIASAWTEAGVPMTAQEAAAYLAEGGTGFGATQGGGLLSQLSGYSNNPMQALQETLQSQVDQGLLTPSQMSQALQNMSSSGSTGSSWLDGILGNSGAGSLLSGELQALGGLLTGNSAQNAAQTQADAIIQAAQIAADAAKFKPVGVSTRFGNSQFGYDAKGNLVTAGYQLAPDVKAQQTALMGGSNAALQQYLAAQGATAPMGQTAQTLFGLGQGYLGTTPQEQAAKYMAEQQALLAPGRERDFAALENRLANQGRLGLATGGTSTGLGAANPELESFYNAQRMEDLKLASQATQGGMDYAKFGAGLVGTGGDMLKSMYGTQVAAYDPYKTAIGGASMLEGLGQNAMDLGINIGAKGTAANAQSGMLLSQGMTNAANVMATSNAYSPWGSLLSGAGTMLGNYAGQQNQQQQQDQQYRYDPYTGQQVRWN